MKKRIYCLLGITVFALGICSLSSAAQSLDGAALYGTYCAGCHGPLATSSKIGRTAAEIQNAINSLSFMSSLKSLTPAQIDAIAAALAPQSPPPPPPPPPPSSDTTPPTVTGFTIPATSDSLTVPITTFTATDNVGVTGYMLTESATSPGGGVSGWHSSAPASYTFTTGGAKTLYAWAKDAAGNVSASLSATVDISITTPPPPPPPGSNEPDMTGWVGKWFKIEEKDSGYYLTSLSTSTSSSASSSPMKNNAVLTGYLKIWGWDSENKVLKGDRYEQDQSGQWVTDPFDLHYLAGSDVDFLCWSQTTGDFVMGFTARLQAKKKNGVLATATLKSLGGFYMETSSEGGSSGGSSGYRAGGKLSFTGTLVSESSVPVPSSALIH